MRNLTRAMTPFVHVCVCVRVCVCVVWTGSYEPVLYMLTLMPACCAILNLVLLQKPPLPPEVVAEQTKESMYSA